MSRFANRNTSLSAKPALESLESRENPTVYYYGGNVLPQVEVQPVYYGATWSADSTTRAYTDAFLKDVTNSVYMDVLKQAGYGVGRGSASTGIVDPLNLTSTASSGVTITDSSIQSELRTQIANKTLPAVDANRLYVVFVQPNVAVDLGSGQGTTQQGILGYHGAFAGPNGGTVRYAVIATPGGNIGNSSLGTTTKDQYTDVASHELAEGVTDPDVNYGTLGWYDPRRGEIGDITENNPNANVRLDGTYLVQQVAGQNDQMLLINVSPPPPPTSSVGTTSTLTAGTVSYYGYYATVKLTLTVKPNSGTALPGGTVKLIYNGQVLGTATLHVVNGVETATFNIVFYANGDYTFSAQYAGNSQFQGSTSNSVTVLV